jgi:hypothetical protein
MPPPGPDAPTPFAMPDPDALVALLHTSTASTMRRRPGLIEDVRASLEPFSAADGSISVPASAIVAVATA